MGGGGRHNEMLLHFDSSTKPRILGYYFDKSTENSIVLGKERIDPNLKRLLTNRIIHLSKSALQSELRLRDSNEYRVGVDPMYQGDCEPTYEWQVKSNPSCNVLYENVDLTEMNKMRRHSTPPTLQELS